MTTDTTAVSTTFRAEPLVWRDGAFVHPPPTGLDGEDTLVMVFADPTLGDDGGPVAQIAQAFPASVVLACSTAGEIRHDVVEEGTLSGVVMAFADARLRWATHEVEGNDPHAIGVRLAVALDGPDLRAVFVVSDGLAVNGSRLVAGITDTLGADVAVCGALAGDGERFSRTWVMAGGPPREGLIAAVGIYGDRVQVGVGSGGGWSAFGPGRAVTASEGNVLHALDGSPALPLYREYLGDYAASLPGAALLFPLSVSDDTGQGAVVRTILAIDEQAGTMTFAGDVPQDATAHLMTSTTDQLAEAAASAATAACATLPPGAPVAAVAVSCVGRRLAMGQRTDDELVATLSGLPPGAVLTGFYSYGEIGPGDGGRAVLHNQTMTVLAVTER